MKKILGLIFAGLVFIGAFVGCEKSEAVKTTNDFTPPTITMTRNSFDVPFGEEFLISDYAEYINISDDYDGNIDPSNLATDDVLDTTVVGSYSLMYYVKDAAGNIATADITVTVLPQEIDYSSYSEDEHKMYQTVINGMNAIHDALDVPSSIEWYGFHYNSDDNVASFYFSAENSFGARMETYAVYHGRDGFLDSDEFYKRAYNSAEFSLTFDEINTYVDSYNKYHN